MITDKELNKHFGHLEDHQYKHFNRALGVQVEGKEHYKHLLNKHGFVPQDMGDRMAAERKDTNKKYDGLSKQAMEVCISAKAMADRKGNIKAGSRLIDGMKKAGVDFNMDDRLPSHYQPKGGFKQ
jgi:hypothetical protein